MSYQQRPSQHRWLASRNQETFFSDSPLNYPMTQPYYSGSPTTAYSPPAYNAPGAPAMRYTSSTDSNCSGYTASKVSPASSSAGLTHNSPLTPPSNVSSPQQSGNVPGQDTAVLDDEDLSPNATPSKYKGKKTQERPNDRYVCLHEGGCTSSFSRPADLTRHYASVHRREEHMVDCPVPLCSRKGSNGFPRQDHLRGHLRGFHGPNVERRFSTSRSSQKTPSSPSFYR